MTSPTKNPVRETLRHQLSDSPTESPDRSIAATDSEVRNLVYESYASRVKSFRVESSTILRSNLDDFSRGTIQLSQSHAELKAPTLTIPFSETKVETFIALQSWEGYIVSVSEKYFDSRITDLKNGEEEDARIPLTMVSPGDRKSLQIGAVFYWSIGQKRDWADQVETTSVLRFKRLNPPTDADARKAEEDGQRLAMLLGFATNNDTTSPTSRS